MSPSVEKWQQLLALFHKKALRERVLLLSTALLLPLFLAENLFFSGYRKDIQTFEKSIQQVQTDTAPLDQETQSFQTQIQSDPDQQSKDLIMELGSDIAKLDQQLKEAEINLIQPKEMTQVLRTILTQNHALALVKIQNLAPTPMAITDEKKPCEDKTSECVEKANIPTVFEHRVVLNLTGSYPDTLNFIVQIEKLPWQLFLDQLSISMQNYPNAMISLTLKTLSLQAKWIGV